MSSTIIPIERARHHRDGEADLADQQRPDAERHRGRHDVRDQADHAEAEAPQRDHQDDGDRSEPDSGAEEHRLDGFAGMVSVREHDARPGAGRIAHGGRAVLSRSHAARHAQFVLHLGRVHAEVRRVDPRGALVDVDLIVDVESVG